MGSGKKGNTECGKQATGTVIEETDDFTRALPVQQIRNTEPDTIENLKYTTERCNLRFKQPSLKCMLCLPNSFTNLLCQRRFKRGFEEVLR